jgi:hypothetical protein
MADAPRLEGYLQYGLDRPVIHMRRHDWASITTTSTGTVLVDILRTPLAEVATDASVVATYAHRYGPSKVQVGVIRLDLKDAPDIYNTDKYEVWEDLTNHPRFTNLVAAASTQDNQNLRDYLAETVFLTKLAPDSEHRRPDLPATLRILLREPST